jgi:hypothetical protein
LDGVDVGGVYGGGEGADEDGGGGDGGGDGKPVDSTGKMYVLVSRIYLTSSKVGRGDK